VASPTRIRLVVGLGNPGPRYAGTRHNLGFDVLERLGRTWGARFHERFEGLADQVAGPAGPLCLLMPHTFMNESGRSVAAARRRMGLRPDEILVVCDDLDLKVGQVRVRPGGSSGGHNGLKSIMAVLAGDDFGRVRLGIGRPPAGVGVIDYVLTRFAPDERDLVGAAVERACDAVACVAGAGYARAMDQFNGPAAPRLDAGPPA